MTREQEVAWCKNQWDLLHDGGVWGVPRCGLILTKREAEMAFVVTSRMPYDPAMSITPAQLIEQQDSEIASLRERFAELGIDVREAT